MDGPSQEDSGMTKTLRGKCPQCCPDGGAVFDNWGTHKECRNCGLVIPIRKIKPSGKPSKSQERILKQIVDAFGGTPETEMIGRKMFVKLVNRERNWILGDSLFGTIGVGGKFRIELQRAFVPNAIITDQIGIDVYLRKY
jgi:hypothetical protein